MMVRTEERGGFCVQSKLPDWELCRCRTCSATSEISVIIPLFNSNRETFAKPHRSSYAEKENMNLSSIIYKRTALFSRRLTTFQSNYIPFHAPHLLRNMSNTSPSSPPLSTPACTLSSLDHLVLTVRSIPISIKFYTSVLGMAHQSFIPPSDSTGTARHALLFGSSKINLHEAGKEFEPKARIPTPGSADLCFLTDAPVEEAVGRLKEMGVEVLTFGNGEAIVKRTGARNPLRSLYLRDPDGNLIE